MAVIVDAAEFLSNKVLPERLVGLALRQHPSTVADSTALGDRDQTHEHSE
ncbi:hypothetical protein [Lichenibacterium ramalinae]|nr:hypothetical protein [Lichenibacterium ramalinae]